MRTASVYLTWLTVLFVGIAATNLNVWGQAAAPSLKISTTTSGDTWAQGATNSVLAGRAEHTAVWTGNEMIVWGGYNGIYLSDGARYNPASNTWRSMSTNGAPSKRNRHTAIWTGTEMIVWGGHYLQSSFVEFYWNDGGRYNPTTDTWSPMSTNGAPVGRELHTAVWTGNEMIVWGGSTPASGTYGYFHNNGGRYNPVTDSWAAMTTNAAPAGRNQHTAVWTGNEMIVWGGYKYYGQPYPGYTLFNDGGYYTPALDNWTALPTNGAPSARVGPTAVWTGTEMVVWGGAGANFTYVNSGRRYNLITNGWASVTLTGAPNARANHTAVWTGSEMLIWGGGGNNGGRYNPVADTWSEVNTNNAPVGSTRQTAVWTGTEMIVWGGSSSGVKLTNAWSYFPCGSAILSWSVSSNTFSLWQNSDLATTNWIALTNPVTVVGSENQVVVAPLGGNQFFRLRSQ